MDLNAIILILVAAGVIYFGARVLGKSLKIGIQILLAIIVFLALLTAVVYKDMDNLKKGFQEGNNTFMLYEDGQLYSAIILKPIVNITLTLDSFGYFTEEEMTKSREALSSKDYESLLKNSKRLFIFKPAVMNTPYNMDFGPEIKLNEKDLLDIIMSDNPYHVLAQKLEQKYNMTEQSLEKTFESLYGDKEKFKG